jgi:hypothetical protein
LTEIRSELKELKNRLAREPEVYEPPRYVPPEELNTVQLQ